MGQHVGTIITFIIYIRNSALSSTEIVVNSVPLLLYQTVNFLIYILYVTPFLNQKRMYVCK